MAGGLSGYGNFPRYGFLQTLADSSRRGRLRGYPAGRDRRREYERAVTTLDPTNPQHARVLSKLAEDLHRAETDIGWMQQRLDEAREKGSAAFRRA